MLNERRCLPQKAAPLAPLSQCERQFRRERCLLCVACPAGCGIEVVGVTLQAIQRLYLACRAELGYTLLRLFQEPFRVTLADGFFVASFRQSLRSIFAYAVEHQKAGMLRFGVHFG